MKSMNSFFKYTSVALVAGMAMVAATNSQAAPVPINASMDVTGIGTSTFVGSNLNAATSINFGTVSGNTFMVTGTPTPYLGNSNNFTGTGSDAVATLSLLALALTV